MLWLDPSWANFCVHLVIWSCCGATVRSYSQLANWMGGVSVKMLQRLADDPLSTSGKSFDKLKILMNSGPTNVITGGLNTCHLKNSCSTCYGNRRMIYSARQIIFILFPKNIKIAQRNRLYYLPSFC
jgi:hypothetical protein